MLLRLSLKDLTLLFNACAEAAQFRRDHGLRFSEKYLFMKDRLDKIFKQMEVANG